MTDRPIDGIKQPSTAQQHGLPTFTRIPGYPDTRIPEYYCTSHTIPPEDPEDSGAPGTRRFRPEDANGLLSGVLKSEGRDGSDEDPPPITL